jgi:hypothetical protein
VKDPTESAAGVAKGMEGLESLVGKEQAARTLAQLTEWRDQIKVPDSVYDQPTWDVATYQQIYQDGVKKAESGDPLIANIVQRVKKFEHGKLYNFSASMVESTLAGMTLTAGMPMVAIGAEALNTAFVMSTGGPEECKILKELYFGRRLEFRRKRIQNELQLALASYEKALMTRNDTLLASSEAVMAQLVGPDALPKIIGRESVVQYDFVPPVELAQKK